MTATSSYVELMAAQVEMLMLSAGESVVDLGCGTGAFASHLIESHDTPPDLVITHVDYITEALKRH